MSVMMNADSERKCDSDSDKKVTGRVLVINLSARAE